MHCYFVLAGNADIPIVYHVEHVREGRSFATRTVQARQRGKVIFTVTLSFAKENSGGKRMVEHAVTMPETPGPDEGASAGPLRLPQGPMSPFEAQRIEITNDDSPHPHTKRTRQWMRARGKISPSGGHEAHLAALAYMSDSSFIGTISRVHKLAARSPPQGKHPEQEPVPQNVEKRPQLGMMVSLDHTIYFHSPRDFRADDWIFTEMESPWSGDGRGLVMQHMWTRDGRLIATCVQEVSIH